MIRPGADSLANIFGHFLWCRLFPMNPRTLPLRLILSLTCAAGSLHAEVKLSKVFTPHMVLQRGMAVPVFGTAAPGEEVTVRFREQTKTTKANKDGQWSVKLDALKAGGPDVLTIGDKKIDDVLVGEVWVGSGQSNMDMPVASYTAGDPVLAQNAQGTYPKLRLLKKGPGDVWQEATPANIPGFSALLFSFGLPLQKELDVPVGLMVGAVGGTPSGYWLSEEMYRADTACAEAAKKFAATYNYDDAVAKYNEAKVKYEADLAAWKPLADAAKAEGKQPPTAPRAPQPVGKAGEVPPGNKIGQLFEAFVRPYVGYGIKGVLWDQGESRTNVVGVPQYELMGALIKGWRKDWGQGDFPFLYVQKPSGGGCAWDYEAPMMNKADKFTPLPKTIPVGPAADYSHPYFATFMQYPKTYMVTSSDLGSGIHPTNKSGYGTRAEQVAMRTVYGGKGEFCGPLYASQVVEGGKVRIKFTHVGKGLAFKNGEQLQGFMIAGADKKFVWADAVIDGADVIVSSKEVAKPEAVRYAWSQNFPWANLFNQDGLPATPFRTDSW
jgi:sialate O-acetylesterase